LTSTEAFPGTAVSAAWFADVTKVGAAVLLAPIVGATVVVPETAVVVGATVVVVTIVVVV
jgi:hypothetical protein